MSNSFVIFSQRVGQNIHSMAEKAHRQNNLIFRPHFKTHQNYRIGNWFRQEGVDKITVSSLEMASFFMADGWNDITIAFPFDRNELAEIDVLASKISIQILVSNKSHLGSLLELKNRVGVMVEIDVGYHRSGIWHENLEEILEVINKISAANNLFLSGLLAHFGNSYKLKSKEDVRALGMASIYKLQLLKTKLIAETGVDIKISIGDTPTASVIENFKGIDELRPGNFVFYDLMQLQIGSCTLQEIAAVMRCAIVDIKTNEKQLIIHGGAVHFSREFIETEGVNYFGQVVQTNEKQWNLRNSHLISLSQEHGIIQCDEKDFSTYKIGDYVDIIPVHSCLTANLMKGKFRFVE